MSETTGLKHTKVDRCSLCKIELILDETVRADRSLKRGYRYTCNSCLTKRRKERRQLVRKKFLVKEGLPLGFFDKGGYLYVATNKKYPGWHKLGCSVDVKHRLYSLNCGSPFEDITCDYKLLFPYRFKAERECTDILKSQGIASNKEWYNCSLETMKIAVDFTKEKLNNNES